MSVSAITASTAMAAWAQSMAPQDPAGQARVTEQELAKIQELSDRDREVRAHEAAHQAAGGRYTGPATYSFERGPDGKMYAVGGEVSVDTSKVADDPRATIEKMRTVHAAALAPANPSAQDMRVAAQAMMALLQAQLELAKSSSDEQPGEVATDDVATAD